jgi:hypothetical protein
LLRQSKIYDRLFEILKTNKTEQGVMFFKKEQDSQTRKRVVLSKETVKQELDLF